MAPSNLHKRVRLLEQVNNVAIGTEGVIVDEYPTAGMVLVEFDREDDDWLLDVPITAFELVPK